MRLFEKQNRSHMNCSGTIGPITESLVKKDKCTQHGQISICLFYKSKRINHTINTPATRLTLAHICKLIFTNLFLSMRSGFNIQQPTRASTILTIKPVYEISKEKKLTIKLKLAPLIARKW